MRKRLLSMLLAIMMIVTSLPLNSYAADLPDVYTAEQIMAQGNKFYNSTKKNDTSWNPASLTAFTIKAAELGEPVMPAEDAYDYFNGIHKRSTSTKSFSLLGLIDKIWDQLATEKDDSEIRHNIIELLSKQRSDGTFSDNSFEHAQAVLVLDAYYGLDYDEDWIDRLDGEGYGRISAVKALTNIEGNILWNKATNVYKGYYLNLTVISLPSFPNGFMSGQSKPLYAYPLIVLSSYMEHPEIGEVVTDTVSICLAQIESSYHKDGGNSALSVAEVLYLISAIVSLDNAEINPIYCSKLAGQAMNVENNKVDALSIIEDYGFIPFFDKYDDYKDDGGFRLKDNSSDELTEFFTQKAVIAASDILSGETAYKRIKGVRAIALDKVKEAMAEINIPAYVEVNPESIQAGNNTASISLPTQGINGTSITWTSSDPAVISSDGTVTFPEKTSKKVTLIAEVSAKYDSGKILSKTRGFEVEVQSMVVGEAGQLLGERFAYISDTYGKDISSLGWEGAVALGETGIDLSGYTFGQLSDRMSADDCAKNIVQIVIMGKNPYDYNGIDYVEKLKGFKDDYSGNPIVLMALEAAGEEPEEDLKSAVMAKTVTSTSISAYSLAVNALSLTADADDLCATSPSAITTGSAVGFREIYGNYIEFIRLSQNRDGMFGDSLNEHAEAVSALTALGEDMFTPEYVKDGNTVLDPVKNSPVTDLSSLKILADIVAGENLWHRIQVTKDKYIALVNRAEGIVSTGKGKYSPKTLQKLEDALKDVGSGSAEFGKNYYELKSAIDGLSTDFLPEFTDLEGYTEESTSEFISAANEFYKFLKTGKSSVSRAKEYAGKVTDAYNALEPAEGAASGKIANMLPKSYAGNNYNYESLKLSDSSRIGYESAPYIAEARRILEKTSKAYDERYGYDVSSKGYWGVFEVCAMGKDVSKYNVYDVTNHKKGLLATYQATDFAAIILQLVLTGENPYDYNGVNYVDWLLKKEQVENGEGNGNFGPYANNIWALMALGAVGEYNEKLVKTVTSMAKKGEWADTEAWALAAIQNYKDEISEADMEIIINNFHGKMLSASNLRDDWSIGNSFTQGCVISGLVAAGEDITSEKWTAKGLNILTSMEKAFQTEDGKFKIGDNFEPDFVKDAIIALGDASQGSNVWQRTYLDNEKLEAAIAKGTSALNGASKQVPEYKKSALKSALDAAEGISNVKGNGHIYFRLLEAIKDLNEIKLPEFTEKSSYTVDSFMRFENALKSAALMLMQTEARASYLNNSCIEILNAYDNLKEVETNPGGSDGDKISVTFRLMGAVKHGGKGTVQTLRKGNLKTWISRTKVEVNKGAKVYDVFKKVLDENGYDYIGAEDNYVSRIITPDGVSLGEFDNGALSGWMYTVNGKHPGVGLRAYTLSDGDDIIWHYTDDYTQEEGSEKWNSQTVKPKTDSSGVSVEIQSKKDKNDVASAKLTSEEAKAFSQALEKTENKDGMSAVIQVKLPEGTKGMKAEIPEEIMKALKSKDNLSLKISSNMWGMLVDAKALKSIIEQSGTKKLEISFIETEIKNLTEEAKELLGDRKIYNVSVYSNGKYISSFGDGELYCHIPYDAGNEDVSKLSVYKITDAGSAEKTKNSSYDEKSKLFKFKVNSLSYFAVGYDGNIKISFTDVPEGHWAYEHIMNLAEKGILNGRAENIFAPEDTITRAEFAVILAKMSGDDLSGHSATAFDDVKNDDWFMQYVSWANENGIAMGYDKMFNPGSQISRQDMAVMLVRYMNHMGKELGKGQSKPVFADDAEIGSYAREAVYYMAESGIISGRGNNIFTPKLPATRAEAAKMINSMLAGLERN